MTFFAFLLTAIIGGSNAALIKFTGHEFSPITITFVRFTLALLIILPIALVQKIGIPKNLKGLFFLTNLMFTANVTLFAIGVQKTSVIMSQFIYLPTPILVALIGFLFLKEKITKSQFLGLALSLCGISLLFIESTKTQDVLSFGTPLGNVLVMLGVVCWAFYLVFSRKVTKLYSPLTVTFYNFLMATIASSLILPIELRTIPLNVSKISTSAVLVLLAIALFSTVFFFFLYTFVVKRTSAFISSLVTYVATLWATWVGIVFFNERLSLNLILGGVLIILGVFISTSLPYVKRYLKKNLN